MNAVWSEEAGDPDRPLIALVHGSMDRSSGMLKLSRRLDADFRVLRYDRRGYGRSSPHPGPFTMAGQVADLVNLLAGRRRSAGRPQLRRRRRADDRRSHPDLVAGVAVYETPLSWLPWWPNTTAGSIAIAEQRDTRLGAEQFMQRILGARRWEALPERVKEVRRLEGVALVAELSDLRDNQPWHAEKHHRAGDHGLRKPGVAAPSSRNGVRRRAARLSGRRTAGLPSRRSAESSRPVPDGDHRPAAAGDRHALHERSLGRAGSGNRRRRDLDVVTQERAGDVARGTE
jgi:hypothetical protein